MRSCFCLPGARRPVGLVGGPPRTVVVRGARTICRQSRREGCSPARRTARREARPAYRRCGNSRRGSDPFRRRPLDRERHAHHHRDPHLDGSPERHASAWLSPGSISTRYAANSDRRGPRRSVRSRAQVEHLRSRADANARNCQRRARPRKPHYYLRTAAIGCPACDRAEMVRRGRRFESGRGLCKGPVKQGHPTQPDLHKLQYVLSVEPLSVREKPPSKSPTTRSTRAG
jgi:hypothetical protein